MGMGNNSISLNFTSTDPQEDINAYIIAYKSESSSIWNELMVANQTPPIIVNDLKESVFYVFKFAAQNANGIGEFSDESYPVKVTGKY